MWYRKAKALICRKPQELAFSVTADDCDWDTMTAGGPGGQHQNRAQTAVRCTHRASGAVGVSREYKSQIQNKRAAFVRMARTEEFTVWAEREVARRKGVTVASVDERVEALMAPENLQIEVYGPNGWETIKDDRPGE